MNPPDSQVHLSDVEAMARALYETSAGTNGYPPLHKSVAWDDLMDAGRLERERAQKVLALYEEYRR